MADLSNLVISFQNALEELVVNPLLVEKLALAAHQNALKYYRCTSINTHHLSDDAAWFAFKSFV
jgi:hypothetical protein